jgi:hypothetical protein
MSPADNLLVKPVQEPISVHRIVRNRTTPETLDSLRSHYERELPPRGYERRLAVIHMGLSVFSSRDAARAMALRWPRIGIFLAELRLHPNEGFCLANTGRPGHLTLWGRPAQLFESIADIVHVED